MGGEATFFEDPDGTREEIMLATYRAFCEHGYADLTIQRISEHFSKSPSLLYHHYDGKDELMLSFLEYSLEAFEATIPEPGGECSSGKHCAPEEYLHKTLEGTFALKGPAARDDFESAMVELRAQAAHDDRFGEKLAEHDRFFADRLEKSIRAGIEAGKFRDVDPEPVASFLVTTFVGIQDRRTTSGAEDAAEVREELESYLEAVLYEDVEWARRKREAHREKYAKKYGSHEKHCGKHEDQHGTGETKRGESRPKDGESETRREQRTPEIEGDTDD